VKPRSLSDEKMLWPAAVLSPEEQYRYFLSRSLASEGPKVLFIGLNPSTADAVADDPTIRRCVAFARSWGASAMWMANLFAYRSSSPKALRTAADPIGPQNDEWIERTVAAADLVVAAWGNDGGLLGRAGRILERHGPRLQALRVTRTGMPGHPLYVRGDVRPTPLSVPQVDTDRKSQVQL
jgi:hypothetical protein